ncbi:hypothetical protein V6N13_075528 [Hibiscus sabdariffa]
MVVPRTSDLIYTGQLVDYFDRCDVDEMSIFEMIDMIEKLGLSYTMKIFWLVSEKPFEVKLLASDNDVLDMVSKLPRNHYVHVYLEEVLTTSSAANVEHRICWKVSDAPGSFEPDFNVEVSDADGSFEPDCNVEVSDAAVVSDDDSLEENIGEASEIRVESNSDSEDIDYEASKSSTHESGFSDSDAEASDDVSDVHVGVGDKMRVGIDDDSGHSDSLHSVDESDSDGPCRKQRFLEFNTTVDISDPTFKVGLLFATKQVLREVVKMYSIKNRYNVRLKRNGNRRIQADCKAGCPWVLWASPVDLKEPYGTWQVKSLTAEHRCLKEYKNPNITSNFMAKQYLDVFHIDPNYSAKSLKKDVFKDYNISFHLSKCYRAKNLALEMLHGNVKEQYKKLYDYLAELRWMSLEGLLWGQLLAAVGMDANDSLYSLAFAVVEVENESSWCWFLERLMTDFELNNSHHISFMTDRQKIKRAYEPTVHQDQSTTPSPRPSQPDIHTQSNIPRPSQPDIQTQSNISRPSQPLPPPYTARWMPTPTVPFTQESHIASPSQYGIHPQSNIPRPSQPLPPPYTARWMPTPTVPFTQESHTASLSQSGIHAQSNIPRLSQPLPPPYIVRWMPTSTIPSTQESSITQSSPQDLAEKRLRSDP